jgi:hypothetical protein
MPERPDPTFQASAKLAMQAPPEKLAYTVMLSQDFSQPDALAVVDLDPGSKSLGKIVHIVTMPSGPIRFRLGSPRPSWRRRSMWRMRKNPRRDSPCRTDRRSRFCHS